MGLRRRPARVHSDRLQQGVRLLPEWLYEIPPMLRCQQRAMLRLESTLGGAVGCDLGVACPSFLEYFTVCPSPSTSVSLRGAATGGAATGANYSSAAWPSEQLLP